jgi:hypothetical protein
MKRIPQRGYVKALVRRFRKIAKKALKLHVCRSARPSAWNYSAAARRIFTKFGI